MPGTFFPNWQYIKRQIIIDIAYADLLALQQSNALKPFRQYRITDFRTYHLIPNTGDYWTGATEVLIVTASSVNSFYAEAKSELYPQDIVHYSFIDADNGGDRGIITYRKDTLLSIETHYDWRNAKFARWEDAVGSGVFRMRTDPGLGEARQDFYTFNAPNLSSGTFNLLNISIGKTLGADALGNNVFIITDASNPRLEDLTIGDNSTGNTIIAYGVFGGNLYGSNFRNNTLYTFDSIKNNIIGDGAADNILNCLQFNIIGMNFSGNTSAELNTGYLQKNTFGHNCTGNSFMCNVQNCNFYTGSAGNTMGATGKIIDGVSGTYINCTFLGNFLANFLPTGVGAATIFPDQDTDLGENYAYGTGAQSSFIGKRSDFVINYDITNYITNKVFNLGGIDNEAPYAGRLILHSSNPVETIKYITSGNDVIDIELKPEYGLTLILEGTLAQDMPVIVPPDANFPFLMPQSSITLYGDKGDSVLLRPDYILHPGTLEKKRVYRVIADMRSEIDLRYTLTPEIIQRSATMVANNDPAPNVVSADDDNAGLNPAFNAWNGDGAAAAAWETVNVLPHWNKYDFGSGLYAVNRVGIQAGVSGNEAYAPKDFIIQGSNNDADWTDLSTQTGIIFTDGELKDFVFSNSTVFRYFRLYITAVGNDDTSIVKIAELYLWTASAGSHKDNPYNLGANSETDLYVAGSIDSFIFITQSAILGFNKIFNASSGKIYVGVDWANGVRRAATAYTLAEFNDLLGWRIVNYTGMYMELYGMDSGTGGPPTTKYWQPIRPATETSDINVRFRGGRDLLSGWEERYTLNAADYGNRHAPGFDPELTADQLAGIQGAAALSAANVAATMADVRLQGYTVATLPAGTQGDTAFVTDATAPTFLGALTGGGAVVTPVFFDGTIWVSF